jgi:poly-beta-1,6-N-acetyl-D-glucosamine biosynthesis protein PgaD
MEKPGQGPPHPEVFIEEKVKTPLRRFVEDFITVACWALYVYLLLPLFTLVLWVFGVHTFYEEIIGAKGYAELLRLLENGGITTLVIFLIVSGWTYYNYLWFKRRGERRGNAVRISNDAEIARMLDVDISAMDDIRVSPRLIVKIENGNYRIVPQEPPNA